MEKYRVFIKQINQTHYDVKAKNKENAIKAAKKAWRMDYYPEILEVETDY